ncbi:MAG: hypothetical protein JSU81_00015 [Candidatus Coatesbacteria bacterium]|nr:MAG: hypothetical protein JSU81_00015 [Candidatus Coatesbacteria bacterium]
MEVVPLNKSHVAGAVALHRSSRPRCYRGKNARAVLRSFYEAYANHDYTVGTAAVAEGEEIVAVVCGTTRPEAPAQWLKERRPWRSLAARTFGGAAMATGGWPVEVLSRWVEEEKPVIFVLSAVWREDLGADQVRKVFEYFGAASASRGAALLCAPSLRPEEGWEELGYASRREAGRVERYVKSI